MKPTVQVKETRVKVSAMKKTPAACRITESPSEVSSCSFWLERAMSQLGTWISKRPKRLKAKTKSNSPRKTLKPIDAEIACIPTAPKARETTTPIKVKVPMIETA